MRKEVVIAVGWFGAVATAAVVGFAAIDALGTTGGGDPPLSQQDVNDGLSPASGSGSSTLSQSATSGPPSPVFGGSAAVRSYISSKGGTLWAACVGDVATLDSVSPSQGFRLDDKTLGPATLTSVTFKFDVRDGHGVEYVVTVRCVGGVPQEHIAIDD